MFEFFSLLPVAGYVAFALLGLCIGSFANVVIYRLPLMEKIALARELGYGFPKGFNADSQVTLSLPASRCSHCGHKLTWSENIPVVSYLVLRGKCSVCEAPYGSRYALVELGMGILFAVSFWVYGPSWNALSMALFGACLVILAMIDADTMELPDAITKPLVWVGMLASMQGWTPAGNVEQALLGAMSGYLAMWMVHRVFLLVTGNDALGEGDFKLVAALGAWLGWMPLSTVLFVGAVSFVVWNLYKRWSYQNRPEHNDSDHGFEQNAFGPWLVLGSFVATLQLAFPGVKLFV